jgi:bcr-type benzoyl-CoA reductase subunit B
MHMQPFQPLPLKATALTQKVMKDYYAACRESRARGRKVAWSTVMMPTELLLAADIDVLFPENHAATCGTQGLGPGLSELAEAAGLSQETCSYVRCDLGVRQGGTSPWGGMPTPDIVFCATSSCTTVMKWFEELQRFHGCELAIVDMPYNFAGRITEHATDYIVQQLQDCIAQIEKITGKSFDYARLEEVVALAQTAHEYWRKCLELGATNPSPITTTDILVNMGPIVCLRGTQAAIDVYKTLYEELLERVQAGYVAAGEERFRLVWDNIPFWFGLGTTVRRLSSYGAVIVGATYLYHWVRDIDPKDPLRSMGRAYSTAITMNQSVSHKIAKIGDMLGLYQADGLIIHSNRSCKPDSLGSLDLKRAIETRMNIPVLMLDGDHTDSRAVSDAVVQTRLEAFIESLEQRKYGRLRLA